MTRCPTVAFAVLSSLHWAPLILAATALTSCGILPDTALSEGTPSPSATAPVATPVPSDTDASNSPIPPLPSPSPAGPSLSEACPDLSTEGSSGLPGALILYANQVITIHRGTSANDLRVPLPQDTIVIASDFPLTSPDATRLALQEWQIRSEGGIKPARLSIIDASGRSVATDWNGAWGDVIGWVSDSDIVLAPQDSTDPTMHKFDLSERAEEPLPLGLPDQALLGIDWYPQTRLPVAVLDGSGRFAVFYSVGDPEPGGSYVLWDLQTSQAIWETDPSWGTLPTWDPQWQTIALSMSPWPEGSEGPAAEVLVLSRDGHSQTLTDFGGWYGGDDVQIGNVVWSPDSQRIAYYVGRRASPSESFLFRLAITQVAGGDTLVYCPLTDFRSRPHWSPEGRYLAISNGVVIDTLEETAYRVASDAEPIAWLKPDP